MTDFYHVNEPILTLGDDSRPGGTLKATAGQECLPLTSQPGMTYRGL